MQKLWYRFVRFSVLLAIKLFYRRIEIHGQETYPTSGPVLLAPNHQNAFMDALIPTVFAPNPIHFLVRADVFKSRFAAWFFKSLNMMPVYRQRDGMSNLSKNEAVFSDCFEILRNDGTLLIFPEASHLGERMLRPLSKGFARILFGTLENHEHLDIQVVPVGLNYSNYQDSQSRLIVNWGKPISVKDYREMYKANNAKAMAGIRDDLQVALSREIVDIDKDWGRKAFDVELERILPFFLHRASGYEEPLGEMPTYKAREQAIRALPETDHYFRKIQIYDAEMNRHKLRAPFFFIERKDAGYWVIQNLLLLVFLPVFLLSWLLHAPTYFTIRAVLSRYVADKQFYSSIKLVGTIVLFPIAAIALATALALWTGKPLLAILSVLVFFPLSIFVIRELRLPYRYTLTKWRMLWLSWRKQDLCTYLRKLEQDFLQAYKRSVRQ